MSQSLDPPAAGPSDHAGKSRASPSKKHAKKARESSLGRWIFWAVIGGLIFAVAAEFRAQAAYNKQLKVCQAAVERSWDDAAAHHSKALYDDIQGRFATQPDNYSTGVRGFAKCGIYTWHWQGIRRYKLRLIVDPKSGEVLSVESGDDME